MNSDADLPYEQAKNTEYLEVLRRKLATRIDIGLSRSRRWVDPTGPSKSISPDELHALVGRVGMTSEHEFLGRSFYIGPRHAEVDGTSVFSAFAPVADLFYKPDGGGFDGADKVAVRRTFEPDGDTLTAMDDEWVRALDESPFAIPELQIPLPPPGVTPTGLPSDTEQTLDLPRVDDDPVPTVASMPPSEERPAELPTSPAITGMRSPDAVLRRLHAPRTSALRSVLATLQPDQHELAKHPADSSVVIQGHPGTGKSVIAAYRAAYLISPSEESAGAGLGRVMIVGPTLNFVTHISGLIRPMDPEGQIRVAHLAELMEEVTGLSGPWNGGLDGKFDDVDASARRLTELAVRRTKEAGQFRAGIDSRSRNLKTVYEALRTNGATVLAQITADPAQSTWLRGLPTFESASNLRRFLPLLTQCALSIQSIRDSQLADHIIVDEAQDVSPIEWNVLDQFLRRGGQWTLVGDMNQRRSDDTYASWQDISDHLALDDGTGIEPVMLGRGYRSTGNILRYADSLLPRTERGVEIIQGDGDEVDVHYVHSHSNLLPSAIAAAAQLADEMSGGTVAIIANDMVAVTDQLARTGWRRPDSIHRWTNGSVTVHVYGPVTARGLEFDGVVVIEPGEFKQHVGKAGQLYTSLTRANRRLCVVWHRNLPEPLRQANAVRGR